jgi:multidrug efflux system membrane fusion protein
VLVPDEAVGSDQSQKFVFVVDADNRAQYRAVKTGPLLDGLRIVREGLTTDDWVIVSGTQRARTGQPVDAERKSVVAPPAEPPAAKAGAG